MITRKLSSRYQLKLDPSILQKYLGVTPEKSVDFNPFLASALYSAIRTHKGSEANVSPTSGIIAFTLHGESNSADRVRKIEDVLHGLIEAGLTTREDELLAIIGWLVPIAEDNPRYGSYDIDITLGRTAQRVIAGEAGVSFVGTMRRAKQA